MWGYPTPSNPSDFNTDLIKGVTVSRDLRLAHPELSKRVKALLESYKRMFPTRDIFLSCVYRSPEEQKRLFLSGRFGNQGSILTNCDGFAKLSEHNRAPSRAVDFAVMDGGKVVWEEIVSYPIGNLAREVGLEWGGFWEKWQDPWHIQLPKEVS